MGNLIDLPTSMEKIFMFVTKVVIYLFFILTYFTNISAQGATQQVLAQPIQETGQPEEERAERGDMLRRSHQMLKEERSRRRNDLAKHRRERQQFVQKATLDEEEKEKLKGSNKKLQQKNSKLQRKIKKLQLEIQELKQEADKEASKIYRHQSRGKDSLSQTPRTPERVPARPKPNVQSKSPGQGNGKKHKSPSPLLETSEINWPSLPGPNTPCPKNKNKSLPNKNAGNQLKGRRVGQKKKRSTNATTTQHLIEDPLPTELEKTRDSGLPPRQEGSADNTETSRDTDQPEDEAGIASAEVHVATAEPEGTDNGKEERLESDTSEEAIE